MFAACPPNGSMPAHLARNARVTGGVTPGEDHLRGHARLGDGVGQPPRAVQVESASGFSSSSALPARAARTPSSACTAGGTQNATASQASNSSSIRSKTGAPNLAAASGRRAHTPASRVSGPAASIGACTISAHGPAPTRPTDIVT